MNARAFELALQTAVALNCQIAGYTKWDRKQYYYPDLPKGYQISQYDQPLNADGFLDLPDGSRIGVERAHLEEDTGKSTHVGGDGRIHGSEGSLIDFNRAGVPLVEIVSRPDIRTIEQAKAYVNELRAILVAIEASDAKMEEGSMRVDANVSVRRPGEPLGTRCEIKNVNSVRSLGRAIEYEARRQIDVIEGGGKIKQETRLFDSKLGETRSMRSKEEAHDYRYFPDPDLLPLELDAAWVETIKKTLPELPDEKKSRFMAQGLSAYDASVLVAERELADFYEELAKGVDAKAAANWLNNEILGRLNRDGLSITDVPVSAAANNAIIQMISDKTISGKIAKDLLDIVWTEGGDPRQVVEARGLKQVTDTGAIEAAVDAVIAANPDKVEQAKAKPTMLGWFVGQVMKQTGGKANPQAVNDLLKRKLDV